MPPPTNSKHERKHEKSHQHFLKFQVSPVTSVVTAGHEISRHPLGRRFRQPRHQTLRQRDSVMPLCLSKPFLNLRSHADKETTGRCRWRAQAHLREASGQTIVQRDNGWGVCLVRLHGTSPDIVRAGHAFQPDTRRVSGCHLDSAAHQIRSSTPALANRCARSGGRRRVELWPSGQARERHEEDYEKIAPWSVTWPPWKRFLGRDL